jgi:hypothetical protein
MLGMCYILCMCVCVGTSDSTIASDDPNFLLSLCCVHRALPRGVPGGPSMAPLVTRSRSRRGSGQLPEFIYLWVVFAILAEFDIFSGFLN